jgi:hypothetical protein
VAPNCTAPVDTYNSLMVDGAERHSHTKSTSSGWFYQETEVRTLEGCVVVPPGKSSVKIRLQSNVTHCGMSEAYWTSLSEQATNQTTGQKYTSVSQCCGAIPPPWCARVRLQ